MASCSSSKTEGARNARASSATYQRRTYSPHWSRTGHQVALKRDPDGAWPSNRTSFQALSDREHVLALGESMGPHIGGTFAIWRITPQGRAILGEPL
jgi:hypothetical protein